MVDLEKNLPFLQQVKYLSSNILSSVGLGKALGIQSSRNLLELTANPMGCIRLSNAVLFTLELHASIVKLR